MDEAWDRYKGLLRKCPHHEILRWLQVNRFYNGFNNISRFILDSSVGGSFSKKNDIEAYELLEVITRNSIYGQEIDFN